MTAALDIVQLSRLQFGLTAMYHFLFVPLTLGVAVILGIIESVYVMTGRDIWRRMTKFWGVLFGINFAMGVATGITMEFQFGMNWAYYSHYVGDVFGAPLAIEGLMAFFLEATFIGLFFFGWDKLSKVAHLTVTWLVALGSNLSALWILVANGWMQHPVGARFNPDTMRMEVTDFMAVIFNPVALGFATNPVEWSLKAHEVMPTIFFVIVTALIIFDALRHRVRWYLIAAAVYVGWILVKWPWYHEPLRRGEPLWFWQISLVPILLWLTLSPLISAINEHRHAGIEHTPEAIQSADT